MCQRKNLFLSVCILLFVFVLLFCGCAVGSNNGHFTSTAAEDEQYSAALTDGVRVIARPRPSMEQMYFDFSATTDASRYSNVVLSSPPANLKSEVPKSDLQHKISGEKIEALLQINGQAYDHNTRAYFPVAYDTIHSYQLDFSLYANVVLTRSIVLEIPLEASSQALPKRYDLPDNHFIRLDAVSVIPSHSVDVPAFDAKQLAAIQFTVDSENLTYDLQVKKSQLSTGAAVGSFQTTDNLTFIYYHPIADGEPDITIAFESISYNRVFSGSIDLG